MNIRRISYLFGVLVISALLLGACATAEPEIQEIEVTREVEVEVEKTVETIVEVDMQDFPEGTAIHLVQWSHFVPQYDKWFDPFLEAWGDANGVEVSVDHVGIPETTTTLAAAIDAGEGPTMVEVLFSPSAFVEGVHDLTDVNMRAAELFGEQVDSCAKSSYLPVLDKFYGFCHGWIPDPADYDAALWLAVGFPSGPSTWAELLEGGAAIKDQFGVPLGIGLSPELDSRMAGRAIIWSYGGSIQDENENVVINSPETIAAVKQMAELYQNTMTEEVFAWTAASNNQGLIAGELSYILNSISAYRSLQKIDPAASDNIGFGPALRGPDGERWASAHVWQIYVIPSYVEGAELEAAKAFLLHLVANYNQAVFNSELYNFPAFPSTAPQLFVGTETSPAWLDFDPFGSRPPDKLAFLREAIEWTAYLGFPGTANPAIGEVFASNIIPTMMGQVALGEITAEEAVAEAEAQINAIFDKWRDIGLVGGG
jgi:multiple sugar transport system substrate-binding protein